MKKLITDFNGIAINDKPIKPEDIMVTITIKYEGKNGVSEYQLHYESLADDGREPNEIVKEYVDIDWELCSKSKNISVKRLNKDKKTIISKYAVPKPTKEYLLKEIIGNLEYSSNRDGYGKYDTETYSACGWDDYVGEQKEQASSYAVGVWKAYKKLYLPHKKNYNDNAKEAIQCLFFLRCNLGLFTDEHICYIK